MKWVSKRTTKDVLEVLGQRRFSNNLFVCSYTSSLTEQYKSYGLSSSIGNSDPQQKRKKSTFCFFLCLDETLLPKHWMNVRHKKFKRELLAKINKPLSNNLSFHYFNKLKHSTWFFHLHLHIRSFIYFLFDIIEIKPPLLLLKNST